MLFSRPVPIIAKALVSVALCFASAPAYANACQAGTNCVFPVREAPPPPVVTESMEVVDEGGGWGIWPILGVAALVALAAFLLLDDDDDEEEPISP